MMATDVNPDRSGDWNMIRIIAGMIWLVVQTAVPQANLPPAYPRPGTTKILDNDRVQVWKIAWLKGQPSPLHRHIYDLVGVYYEPGDRMIISPEGVKRPVSTKAWDIALQRSDDRGVRNDTPGAAPARVDIQGIACSPPRR